MSEKKYPQHIVVKALNSQNKEYIEGHDKGQVTYKDKNIIIIIDFSMKNLKDTRECKHLFQVLKISSTNLSYYSWKNYYSKLKEKEKIFHDKRKVKNYN